MSFARNVHFTVKTGKADEFKRLMHTEVFPLLKKEKGFRQAVTVMGANTGVNVTVWDDRATAEAYNSKTYPEVLKKLVSVFEGTPRVENFETVFTMFPEAVHA